MLAQWIQTYQFTLEDYLMIVRTMRSVFPHCGMISLISGDDTLLLASDQPLVPSESGLTALQKVIDASPEIAGDLWKRFGTTDARILLLSRYTVNQEMLDRMLANDRTQQLNTDLNLRLEFDAPRDLFRPIPPELSASQLGSISDDAWRARLGSLIGIPAESAEFLMAQALEKLPNKHARTQDLDEVLSMLERAVALKPSLAEAHQTIAEIHLAQKRVPQAIAALQKWVAAQPDRTEARLALYNACVPAGQHALAVEAIQPLVERLPDNAQLQAALGQELLIVSRKSEAAAHIRQALTLNPRLAEEPRSLPCVNSYAWLRATDPDPALRDGDEALRVAQNVCQAVHFEQPRAIDTLAAAYAETGQFDEAVHYAQQVVERAVATGDSVLVEQAGARLQLYRSGQAYRGE